MLSLYSFIKELVLNFSYSLGFAAGTEWLTAALVFTAIIIMCLIIRYLIMNSINEKRAKKQHDVDQDTDIFDIVYQIFKLFNPFFIISLAIFIASFFLPLPLVAEKMLNTCFAIVIAIYILLLVQNVLFNFLQFLNNITGAKNDEKVDKTSSVLFSVIIKIIIFIAVLLIILQSWGYDITFLLSGLGIGAIIISFSLQSVWKDLFAFFSISSDKMFRVGDYIETPELSGTVKDISFRTTKLRAVNGYEVVVANRSLVDQVIKNYGRMKTRYVVEKVNLGLENDAQKLEKLPTIIEKIFYQNKELSEKAEFRRVYFDDISEFGFIYKYAYSVKTPDYQDYVHVETLVNLAIVEALQKEGIYFAGMVITAKKLTKKK